MAITSISVGTTDVTLTPVLTGASGIQCTAQNSEISISADLQSVVQEIYGSMKAAVKTINSVPAKPDGTMILLGDQCTSVVSAQQQLDLGIDTLGANKLVVIDQCTADKYCQLAWSLASKIQDLHSLFLGMFDNNLYSFVATAETTKSDVDLYLARRQTKKAADHTQNCAYVSPYTENNHNIYLYRGVRLFHQYRALIDMWNYLVTNRNCILTVQQGSTAGSIYIYTRIAVPVCSSHARVTLTISLANTTAGELAQYNTFGLPYAHFVQLYVLGCSAKVISSDTQSLKTVQISDAERSSGLEKVPTFSITFTFAKQASGATYQVGFTVMPAATKKATSYVSTDADVIQYSKLLDNNTQIVTGQSQWSQQKSRVNRWRIDAVWTTDIDVSPSSSITQTKYQTMQYCKVPYIAPDSSQYTYVQQVQRKQDSGQYSGDDLYICKLVDQQKQIQDTRAYIGCTGVYYKQQEGVLTFYKYRG